MAFSVAFTILSAPFYLFFIFFVTEYCYVVPVGLDHPPASQVLDCRQVLGKHLASAFSLEGVGRGTD